LFDYGAGFVRVLAQALQYGFTICPRNALLLSLKKRKFMKVHFIPDVSYVSHFQLGQDRKRKLTDGHLATTRKGEAQFFDFG